LGQPDPAFPRGRFDGRNGAANPDPQRNRRANLRVDAVTPRAELTLIVVLALACTVAAIWTYNL
jgi:hypothetical protein